ncbi:plasmid replication initiator TrfA [Desulfurivibrio sp. D14AmB]|uniref:plasmid replication initiator TrfA n=1 Tax=Desulfurivibrio sp. D14AmB TaxID=3374370 RepID=UPI00376EFF4F
MQLQQSKPTKLDPEPGTLTIKDCPDHAHVAPNICFRSPLFGVCDQRKPLSVMDLPVATVGDKEISYSGFRLSQSDLDIFAHLIRLARERQDETGWGQCSMYEILKATGRCRGKNPRQAVMMSMKRLTASALSITFTEPKTKRRYSYFGPMVHDFLYDHEAETYRFRINTHVAELFGFGWTKIEWEQRLALKGDLAKWLHGYYASSHKKVYPVTVEKIRSLCGSGISQLKVFRARLKSAMEAIKAVGCITGWHIDDHDRVHVSFDAVPLLDQEPNPDNELPADLREYIDKVVRPKAEQAEDPEAYIAGTIRRISAQGGLNSLDLEALQRASSTLEASPSKPGPAAAPPKVANETLPPASPGNDTPLPPGDVPQAWITAREAIKEQLSDSVFNLWIEPLVAREAGNRIVLYGPDRFFCSWVADKYLPTIQTALTRANSESVKISFSVMGDIE